MLQDFGILYFMRSISFKYCIILAISCLLYSGVNAQDKSNRGKEFWLAYGFDYSFFWESPVNFQELAIYISTEQAATVTVSITNTGYTQTLNIPANTVDASILIPKSGANDARTLTDGLQNRNVHIVSNVPVAVYAHVYSTQVSGATMLMPIETYGYSYYSINYYQTTSQSNPADWYSWFYAIASEDNTRIEITPSDTTKNGWLPGQTYTVNLNKGESYHVFGKAVFNVDPAKASKDMTGSKIVSVPGADASCHPIAVFSGSGGIRLCRGDGGEFMHQQVFPERAWGTRYLTYHTINNTNTNILETNRNYYRICVTDPATVVKKNGVVMTGLIKNFFYEHMDSTGGDYFEANKPILVSQYTPNKNQCWNFPITTPAPPSYGDPEMFYISPIEQGQKSVLFYTSRKSGIDYVYANIHLPTAAVPSLKVDGASLPATQIIPHPNYPSYSVALARFIGPAAQHTITSDSAFTSTVYGLGNFESYGYNVGTLINNLNSYSAIKNAFNAIGSVDTFTCVKTPVRLFLKVGYEVTSITWNLSQIPGISPNVDSVVINPPVAYTEIINGRTYFVYTLQQDFTFTTPGTYYIPVSFTNSVTSNCTQTETGSVKVVVKSGPSGNFSFTNPVCQNDSVYFNGSSAANGFNLVNYLWNFADNTSANTINTVKKFTTGGLVQNVRFRVIADNGCLGDTTKIVTLTASPIAKLGLPPSACANEFITITDTSIANSGTIVNWRYDFGDGSIVANSNGNSFLHKYTNPGTYTAKLVVYTANCKSDTSYKTIVVRPAPLAKFGYDKNICLGDSIKFSDSSTFALGIINNWKWNFGDGNTITYLNNTPFYYKHIATGVYPVTLVTEGNNGCNATYTLNVSVNNKPAANFTAVGKPCIDSNFIFTSSLTYNSNNPAIWYWNFGDGQSITSSTTNIANHTYASTLTNITVKHVAGYGPGCFSDTAFYTIPLINPNPAAVPFTLSANVVCAQTPVQFNATPVNGIANWLWNFGNGTGTQVPSFSRTYNAAGNFNISLMVMNAAGCGSVTSTNTLSVTPAPSVNAGADKIISTGSSVILDATITNAANYNFLWTPATYLNSATILNPVATPAGDVNYAIKATDKITNCSATDSVKVAVISKLFIPNAFTPNGDGTNDKWLIPGMALYPDATMLIFNRYGEVIYQTKNYISKPWDGTYKGRQQPSGSYVYLIRFDQDKTEKGIVTIFR